MVGGGVGLLLAVTLTSVNSTSMAGGRVHARRADAALRPLYPPFAARDAAYARPSADYGPERLGFFKIVHDHLRPVILGLMILMGGTVATYVLNYMTTYARTTLHMGQSQSFSATLVNGAFGVVASLAGGWLSDLFGRRRMMIIPRLAFFLAVYPVFLLIVYQHSTLALLAGTAALSVLLNVSSGAFYVAFGETCPSGCAA